MCRTTNNELVFLADNKAQLYKDIWGWGAQGYTGPALSVVSPARLSRVRASLAGETAGETALSGVQLQTVGSDSSLEGNSL